MNHLSLELSKILSELSGHTTGEGYDADGSSLLNMRHYYVDNKDHGIMVVCGHRIKWGEDNDELKVICPAWHVEDVLRNLRKIIVENDKTNTVNGEKFRTMRESIGECLGFFDAEIAYQKIEEYLWSVLR